jgi:hypothetical protein
MPTANRPPKIRCRFLLLSVKMTIDGFTAQLARTTSLTAKCHLTETPLRRLPSRADQVKKSKTSGLQSVSFSQRGRSSELRWFTDTTL